MLDSLLKHLNNWFDETRLFGEFTIENGSITLPFLIQGQYFRIIGSVLNDGVYRYPVNNLLDETFDGAVWALKVPNAILTLSEEIDEWQQQNGTANAYTSESFGGYSYSRATDSITGGAVTWEGAFRAQLDRWRKV